MILDTILKIIPILVSIPACILSLKSLKMYNEIKCKIEPEKETKTINDDEILHSLEFNTELDGKIQPLLGKYSNDRIVTIITNEIRTESKYKIPISKLEEHIRETLRNYQNDYNKEAIESLLDRDEDSSIYHPTRLNPMSIKIDEDYGVVTEINGKPVPNASKNNIDISSTLNNFYK